MSVDTKNYKQWKVDLYRWASVDSFSSAISINDGIHVVKLDSGVEIDLYVKGNPFDRSSKSLLTFFSGAVTSRKAKVGPFFSGLGIANQLNLPVIAIADPGIESSMSVNIAWYTGGPQHFVQDGIAAILDSLQRRAERELLLVGGSGGGFAALYFASRLRNKCSVFVWNPQTDVFEYLEGFVKAYMNGLFGYSNASLSGDDWISRTRKRANGHASLTVLDHQLSSAPTRLFYLQNATDWHAEKHLKPFLKSNEFTRTDHGIYLTDDRHVCLVAHAADGHLPPPIHVLENVIELMGDPAVSAVEVARKLIAEQPIAASDFSTLPLL